MNRKPVVLIPAFLADGQLHAPRYSKHVVFGWCGATGAAEDGIYYVPSSVFDGRHIKYGDVYPCEKCSDELCGLAEAR